MPLTTNIWTIAQSVGAYEVADEIAQIDIDGGHIRFGRNGRGRIAVYGVDYDLPLTEHHDTWPNAYTVVNIIRAEQGLAPVTPDSTTYVLVKAPGSKVVHSAYLNNLTNQFVSGYRHIEKSMEMVFAITVSKSDQYDEVKLRMLREMEDEFLAEHGYRRCKHCR